MKLSLLLIKLLISFPKVAEALRGLLDSYEEELYRRRHSDMRDVIDDWMRSDSSSDKAPRVFREAGSTSIQSRREKNIGGDTSLHQRPRERCPLNEKDCPLEKNTSPKKED